MLGAPRAPVEHTLSTATRGRGSSLLEKLNQPKFQSVAVAIAALVLSYYGEESLPCEMTALTLDIVSIVLILTEWGGKEETETLSHRPLCEEAKTFVKEHVTEVVFLTYCIALACFGDSIFVRGIGVTFGAFTLFKLACDIQAVRERRKYMEQSPTSLLDGSLANTVP